MGAVFADLQSVQGELVAPTVGTTKLDLPQDWQNWDSIWQEVRDTVNKILGVLSAVGLDLGFRLPDGTLVDVVVKPLTGDFDRIRANGDACTKADSGLTALSNNIGGNTVDLALHWSGAASEAFQAQALAYAAVTRAVGAALHLGKLAFTALAETSVELAEVAVKILTKLGTTIVRLAGKIASRMSGWFAWARLAYDLATEGWNAIQDIVDDIKTCITMVGHITELIEKVKAYIQAMLAKFEHFKQLPDLLNDLPNIVDNPLSAGTRTVISAQDWQKKQQELDKAEDKAAEDYGAAVDTVNDDLQSSADSAGTDAAS